MQITRGRDSLQPKKQRRSPPLCVYIVVVVSISACIGCNDTHYEASAKTSADDLFRGAAISVDPPFWNFGTTTETTLTKRFSISNRGQAAVRLSRIATTCGCTTAELSVPCDIAPGEMVSIPVTIVLPSENERGGQFNKSITLHFSDGGREGLVTIEILGVALRNSRLRVVPEFVDFGKFGEWETPSRDISLSAGEHDVQVQDVASTHVGVSFAEGGVRDRGSFVRGTCSDELSLGRFEGHCEIVSNRGRVRIPFRGEKCGRIFLRQPLLVFRSADGDDPSGGVLRVRHDPSVKVNCTSVECSIGTAIIESVLEAAVDEAQIKLRLVSRDGEGALRGQMHLRFEGVVRPVVADVIYGPSSIR